ncbi:MAG TPA: hypothetical protein VML95_01090 [Longimicrobiales bacterium]|nr:hypothetical protein [Longimicrobiales bacterium]
MAMKALIEGQGEAGSTDAQGRVVPYRMRHSQGAQWDFMLVQPIDGLEPHPILHRFGPTARDHGSGICLWDGH